MATKQKERDTTIQVRNTRANLGTLIAELQKAYVRVDGNELADYCEAREDNAADMVQHLAAVCAITDPSSQCVHPTEANTIRRYLTHE